MYDSIAMYNLLLYIYINPLQPKLTGLKITNFTAVHKMLPTSQLSIFILETYILKSLLSCN